MEYINYIDIKIDNLQDNIDYFRNHYNYKYYILDVSNNAFYHGMYIINQIKNIDYLYVNNFKDLLLVRKYNKKIPTIYSGNIDENNIYDLIMNNAILVIRNYDFKDYEEIKDDVEIIISIDIKGYNGFKNKEEIRDLGNLIKNNKHIKVLGLIANIEEEDYTYFKEITLPLRDLNLFILNNELDKNKIKGSNAIKLDNSIYGINKEKKELFKKEIKPFKQAFTLYSKITMITKERQKKKEIILGVIPLGLLKGMPENIKKVRINNKFYEIYKILEEYSLIIIDDDVKLKEIVEITGKNNPLENYIQGNIYAYLSMLEEIGVIIYNGERKLVY